MESGSPLAVNQPNTFAEVKAVVAEYEQALVSNDTATLDRLFWNSPETVRLGASENLFGYAAIAEFRQQRSSKGLARQVERVAITTFGDSMATAHVIFSRPGQPLGRQTQTWLKTDEGWKVVSAHVSKMS